jgi:hypothetical protein
MSVTKLHTFRFILVAACLAAYLTCSVHVIKALCDASMKRAGIVTLVVRLVRIPPNIPLTLGSSTHDYAAVTCMALVTVLLELRLIALDLAIVR